MKVKKWKNWFGGLELTTYLNKEDVSIAFFALHVCCLFVCLSAVWFKYVLTNQNLSVHTNQSQHRALDLGIRIATDLIINGDFPR